VSERAPSVTLRQGLPAWTEVAAESFGGPAAQIGVMHRVIVHERQWVSEDRFQRAVGFCMLLPGPEAQQLATYLGWLLHGTRGALVAGSLFVLPGFLTLLLLSFLYVHAGDSRWLVGPLDGLKPAVVAIMAHALTRMGRRALTSGWRWAIALGAFVALFLLRWPFPLVIALAAATGMAMTRTERAPNLSLGDAPPWRAPVRAGSVWFVLWLAPVAVAGLLLGWRHVLVQEGTFFATSALVTFGGAYSVLTYVAQAAVHRFQWVEPGEMIAGLGLAESTPGPLIQVVQFVAFLGAFRAAAPLEPNTAGVAASLLVTWVTFVPSFFFILALGPFVERLAHNRRLLGALQGVAAGAFGAMLNLALWFAIHTLFADVREASFGPLHLTVPAWPSLDIPTLMIAAAALAALVLTRVKHLWLLLAAAALGLARGML
jgi:chromate transporter